MAQSPNFKDRYGPWALVTGASSGIGASLSQELAKKGLNVVLVARRAEALESTAQTLAATHHVQTRVIAADMGTMEGIETVITETAELEIGFLCPNAGVEEHGEFVDMPIEPELKMLDLNIRAPMLLAHHFGAKMKARKRGGIVFVSSLVGHMPNPYLSNYAGTKAYVLNFGLSLRYELAQSGVDVSVLSPGPTDTPMVAKLGEDVDMSKMPMSVSSPLEVAQEVLAHFPKKPIIIPTRKNRFMVFMATRMMPVQTAINQGGKMMKTALKRA